MASGSRTGSVGASPASRCTTSTRTVIASTCTTTTRARGTPSNGRPLVRTDADWGLPDGLTVDAEGGIWVCFWDGAALRRFAPDGALTDQLDFPAARPTRPAFGGPDLDRLYVTSATLDSDGSDPGGAVFVAELGVRGLPAPAFTPR